MTILAVFPGQGSQMIGMGNEISKNFQSAKLVFDEVDDALNFKLSKIMKEGNEPDLRLTKNAQPALMATGIAVVKVIEELSGIALWKIISHSAGHSLGEYTALLSAGSISISDAAESLLLFFNCSKSRFNSTSLSLESARAFPKNIKITNVYKSIFFICLKKLFCRIVHL